MTKVDLIASVAAKTGLTQTEVKARMESVLECMLEALKNGERITIYNFGMFDVKEYGERKSRNVYKGEAIELPPRKIIKFKVTPNINFQTKDEQISNKQSNE